MIEKNTNIILNKQINRIVKSNKTTKQITILDSRYYQQNSEKFYPSVTYVLSYLPKDKFFETWMKDVGHNADIIMRRAGEEGTQVHNAIEKYLAGEEIHWIDERGNTNFNLEVWKMILKFVTFWETYKPELIASEITVFSEDLETAGTIDLIVKIEGKYWLLDIKTSNSLHESHDIQVAVYKKAWTEIYETPIDETGILWLKAATRGPDKTGKKIQGAGWQIKANGENYEENLKTFKHLFEIFKTRNPNMKPYSEIFQTSVKLNKEDIYKEE